MSCSMALRGPRRLTSRANVRCRRSMATSAMGIASPLPMGLITLSLSLTTRRMRRLMTRRSRAGVDGDPLAWCGWERKGQWLARRRFGDTLRYVVRYLHHDGVVVIVRAHEAPERCQAISPSM